MADAYIFDHVRTPRGRGKKDGALHEVPAVRLAAKTLEAVRDRNGMDTKTVDDVILGCVDPVGEAGGDIARAAAPRQTHLGLLVAAYYGGVDVAIPVYLGASQESDIDTSSLEVV